jgi:hypothetical protein
MISNKIHRLLVLLTSIFFFGVVSYNCTQKNSESASQSGQTTDTTQHTFVKPDSVDKTKYPNEDSELAWLMRQMYDDSEKIRTAILNNSLPNDFRKKFKSIHTATPTDMSVKGEVFDHSAKAFLQTLDKFYTNKENQVENFNLVVNACVSCHQNYCPGPIKRIKKLSILM